MRRQVQKFQGQSSILVGCGSGFIVHYSFRESVRNIRREVPKELSYRSSGFLQPWTEQTPAASHSARRFSLPFSQSSSTVRPCLSPSSRGVEFSTKEGSSSTFRNRAAEARRRSAARQSATAGGHSFLRCPSGSFTRCRALSLVGSAASG
jgi:hypothetical protein